MSEYYQEHTFFQLVKILCVHRMRDTSSGMVLERAVLAVTVLVLWSSSGCGFNIDTQQPIVREPPVAHSGQEFDLFGYSAVLHNRAEPGPTSLSRTV